MLPESPRWLPKVAHCVRLRAGHRCLHRLSGRRVGSRLLHRSLYTSVACHLPSPWESLAVRPAGLPTLPWLVPISTGKSTSVGHCPSLCFLLTSF